MSTISFFERISKQEVYLNSVEKKIVEYVLENYKQIRHLKISTLAQVLFISPNTIIRLCKKLGYSGFSEMKHDIDVRHMQVPLTETLNDTNLLTAMNKTLELNSAQVIDKVAKLLYEANQIYFFALGLSRYAVMPFAKKVQYLKKTVIITEDRDSCFLLAESLGNKDIAVFVSFSGETDVIRQAINTVKTKGVLIISITNIGQNTVAQYSDIALYAYGKRLIVSNVDFTSRLSLELVMEIIFEHYFKLYQQSNC